MLKTMIFHLTLIPFVFSRKIINAKEKSDEGFDIVARPQASANRLPVKELYYLGENNLFKTKSTTVTPTMSTTNTLTTPESTPHNPYISSPGSTTRTGCSFTILASTASLEFQNFISNSKSQTTKNPEEQTKRISSRPDENVKSVSTRAINNTEYTRTNTTLTQRPTDVIEQLFM